MTAAIEKHVAALRDRGQKAHSYERAEAHLHNLLDSATRGRRPVRTITATIAADLYRRAQVGKSVDTHRNALAAGKAWGEWCVEAGWLKRNPFELVKGVGRRKHGKPQLGIDDSRKLLDYCAANPGQKTAAAACCLVLGIRASDLVSRDVRHLDDGARILRVTESKTEAGRLHHELPDVIRTLLVALTGTRPAASPLFEGNKGRGVRGDRRSRFWVRSSVKEVCAAAGVPYVSPHGLRGTQGTLATHAQQTAAAVSAALGHASTAITARAYVLQQAAKTAVGRRAWAVLDGGRSAGASS